MQGIEIPIGAPLAKLDKDLKGAQKALKQYTTYTDAELRKSSMANYGVQKKQLQISESLAEGAAKAAKAIRVQAVETQAATAASGGFVQEIGGAYSSLKGLANILPGIGIAGIFTIAFEALKPLIIELDLFGTKISEIAKNRNDLNAAISKGNEEAGKEISTLKTLYEAATNVSNSSDLRNKAAKELQKQFPETFKNATLEQIKLGELEKGFTDLTKSIIANARAKAIADKIGTLESQLLESDIQKQKILIAQTNELGRVRGTLVASSGGDTMSGGVGIETIQTPAQQKAIINARAKAALDLNSIDNKIIQNKINFLNQFTTAEEKTTAVSEEENDKQTKNKKTQLEILKALDIEYKQIAADQQLIGSDVFTEKIKATKKALNDLIGIGVSTDSGIIKKLQSDLATLNQAAFTFNLKPQADKFADQLRLISIQFKVDAALAADAAKLKLDFIDPDALDLAVFQSEAAAKAIVDKFAAIKAPLLTPFQNLNLYIKDNILPQLSSSFKTFFDDILMNGKFSFDALGQAIKNTFLSVLASEATKGVLALLAGGDKKDGSKSKGLIGIVGSLLKIGGKKAAASTALTSGGSATLASGTAATGGALLPILAGVAAVAGIASLFKKKQQAPIPQASSTISTSAAGSAQDFGGGRVVFEISGTNLIGVLNRAGAKLQRFGP
jgi:hypothetical protein